MILPEVSLVVPLFNEAKALPQLIERLNRFAQNSVVTFEFVLVDDGSNDPTPELLHQVALTDERYQCIFLARNYGHQYALTAGIRFARATRGLMILDGDLQDPPELFDDFYRYFSEGYDVVYGIRKKRKEHFIKNLSYRLFYRILKIIAVIDIPLDSGDFSFISRKVADVLNKMPEESRFIRGMRSWIGFRQIGIEYERAGRSAGASKYTLVQLFRLALNGIFNFSEFPIKFIMLSGIFCVLLSGLYFVITVARKFILGDVPVGFTAILFMIIFIGGVQLLSLGIIGEYVMRIFFQVKQRPLFVVKKRIVDKNYTEE